MFEAAQFHWMILHGSSCSSLQKPKHPDSARLPASSCTSSGGTLLPKSMAFIAYCFQAQTSHQKKQEESTVSWKQESKNLVFPSQKLPIFCASQKALDSFLSCHASQPQRLPAFDCIMSEGFHLPIPCRYLDLPTLQHVCRTWAGFCR